MVRRTMSASRTVFTGCDSHPERARPFSVDSVLAVQVPTTKMRTAAADMLAPLRKGNVRFRPEFDPLGLAVSALSCTCPLARHARHMATNGLSPYRTATAAHPYCGSPSLLRRSHPARVARRAFQGVRCDSFRARPLRGEQPVPRNPIYLIGRCAAERSLQLPLPARLRNVLR